MCAVRPKYINAVGQDKCRHWKQENLDTWRNKTAPKKRHRLFFKINSNVWTIMQTRQIMLLVPSTNTYGIQTSFFSLPIDAYSEWGVSNVTEILSKTQRRKLAVLQGQNTKFDSMCAVRPKYINAVGQDKCRHWKQENLDTWRNKTAPKKRHRLFFKINSNVWTIMQTRQIMLLVPSTNTYGI